MQLSLYLACDFLLLKIKKQIIMADYIPHPYSEFDEWQKNFITKLVAGAGSWNIPPARLTALINRQSRWKTDFGRGGKQADRNGSDTLAMQKTYKVYVKELRKFVQEFIARSSLVTNAQRKAMGVTVPVKKRTSRLPIETAPTVRLIAKEGARFIAECRVESDSNRTSRHKDSDGVELAYMVADKTEPPANPAETTESKLNGSARVWLELDIADAGKSLHIFARWINTTDDSKNGPWSTIKSRVISD
jgi:hypothetical protein